MTIASRTIDRFAEATVVPRVTIGRVARALREADPLLFPRDPIGRNKSTENTPPHFVNLLIGMAVGDPITAAPLLVRAYRHARYNQPIDETLKDDPVRTIIPGGGQTLGLDLERMIDQLARPSVYRERVPSVFDRGFRVALVVGEPLVASVQLVLADSATRQDDYDAKPSSQGQQSFPKTTLHGRELNAVPLRRLAYLDFLHFQIAAELWADSLKRGAVYSPSLLDDPSDDGSDGTSAPSKTKSAKASTRKKRNAGSLRQEVPAPSEKQTQPLRVNEGTGSALPGLPKASDRSYGFQGRSPGWVRHQPNSQTGDQDVFEFR